tara:strand:+ start:319 stop:762 length:444 start_codon:yes stop_codon:yes gene_type:complete
MEFKTYRFNTIIPKDMEYIKINNKHIIYNNTTIIDNTPISANNDPITDNNNPITDNNTPLTDNNPIFDNNIYNNLDRYYHEIATPFMLWEGVYKWYIRQFSKSYLLGDSIYIGESLILSDKSVFKKINTIRFLIKHYSDHPLAPKKI